MSLASLVSSYIYPGTLYADAVAVPDQVAKLRMEVELCEAIRTEIMPTIRAGSIATAVWDRIVRVHAAIFPQNRTLGPTGMSGGHTVRAIDRARIKQLADHAHTASAILAQLKGEFPTAPGVVDPTKAIAIGTQLWAVYEPDGYVNWKALIVEDDGEGPITIQALAEYGEWPEATIARHRVHFEYAPAQIDLNTAAYIDTLSVGTVITNGTLTKTIARINHTTRIITLTSTPSNMTLTFEQAMASWVID